MCKTTQDSINALIATVEELVSAGTLNSGNGNALMSKLGNALKSLDKGNDIAAMNQLLAFINQVQDFISSGTLTAAEGQPPIAVATAIVDGILAGS